MSRGLQISLALGALITVFALFELTDTDLALQDHLFDFSSGRWPVDKHDPALKLIFYNGPKVLLGVYGLCLAAVIWLSYRRERFIQWRRPALFLLLSLAIVPTILSGSKNLTNVYCPSEITRYGGDKPYVRVLEGYPEGFVQEGRGKCFPAGHSSGGFALMAWAFVPARASRKWLGLMGGLVAGWTMGGYQMLKGAHYLSHTVVSMMGAMLIILLLARLVLDRPE